MRPNPGLIISLLGLGMTLGACGRTSTPILGQPTGVPATAGPTAAVAPITQTSAAAVLTQLDPTFGYSFDYPADWMVEAIALGSRAPAAYQLTSWSHSPGMVDSVPEGGSIMNIGVQFWDPKGDLNAFVEQRTLGWQASGLTILRDEQILLGNGSLARAGVLQEPGEGQGYFLFTTLGENYLFATGDGDVAALEAIALSIR